MLGRLPPHPVYFHQLSIYVLPRNDDPLFIFSVINMHKIGRYFVTLHRAVTRGRTDHFRVEKSTNTENTAATLLTHGVKLYFSRPCFCVDCMVPGMHRTAVNVLHPVRFPTCGREFRPITFIIDLSI